MAEQAKNGHDTVLIKALEQGVQVQTPAGMQVLASGEVLILALQGERGLRVTGRAQVHAAGVRVIAGTPGLD